MRPAMRPGFSFTEILFAIMILGIGFIMVAAMFPVAIQQTQATTQETIGASVGRAGVDYMQQIAATRIFLTNGHVLAGAGGRPVIIPSTIPPTISTSILLPTIDPAGLPVNTANYPPYPSPGNGFQGFPVRIPGQVWSLYESTARDPNSNLVVLGGQTLPHRNALWDVAARNLIFPADARNGMVILYKRDLIAQATGTVVNYIPAPDAQIIVIPVRARTKDAYDASDLGHAQGGPAALEPILANAQASQSVQLTRQGITSTLLVRDNTNSVSQRVAEGGYIVIANDGLGVPQLNLGANPNGTGGQYAGHVFQVGVQQGNPFTWTLSPGNDLRAFPGDPPNGYRNPQVFVVGRSFVPGSGPQGVAQDVGIYTGIIPVN